MDRTFLTSHIQIKARQGMKFKVNLCWFIQQALSQRIVETDLTTNSKKEPVKEKKFELLSICQTSFQNISSQFAERFVAIPDIVHITHLRQLGLIMFFQEKITQMNGIKFANFVQISGASEQ